MPTTLELAQKIKLAPRATLLTGVIMERKKIGGSLSGFTPHYAMSGCPTLQFDQASGDPENLMVNGAEIEFTIKESDQVYCSLAARYNSANTFAQLMYGSRFQAPSRPAARILQEAGRIFAGLASAKREVAIAGIMICTSSGGTSEGRLQPIGIFDKESGLPIWINPEAVESGFLTAPYPDEQKERSIEEAPAKQGPAVDWYLAMKDALEGIVAPADLHETVIQKRAAVLVSKGVVKTLEEGLAQARSEAPAAPKTKATPAAAAKKPAAPKAGLSAVKKK